MGVYSLKLPFLPPFPPQTPTGCTFIIPTPAEIGGRMVDIVGLIPILGDILEVCEILYPRHLIDRAERAIMTATEELIMP